MNQPNRGFVTSLGFGRCPPNLMVRSLGGDCFDNEHYASILVMMEVGLMIGRIINLVPTYVLVTQANFTEYFILLGTILLLLIPVYAASKKQVCKPLKT